MAATKTHNGALSLRAKVDLRRRVLGAVREHGAKAHVFDAFCGPVGEMHAAIWRQADSYVGCDREWRPSDARRRFVADAALVLRAVDLAAFNVFDLDAFGSPWTEAIIVAARRRFAPGEIGALVVTDGSVFATLRGSAIKGLVALIGPAHHRTARIDMRREALGAWCDRAGVDPLAVWSATGYSNAVGAQEMFYAAVVFRGAGPRAAPSTNRPSRPP